MQWIYDNIRLIFIVAGGIAWWLNQRKQAQAGKEAPPPAEATFDDPDLAERTRKIREEIQRKIEQRARGYANEQPKTPQSVPVAPPPIIREVVVARQPVRASSRSDAQRQAEILEQQAALMEKLREAELMKAAAIKRTAFEESTADHAAEARTAVRSNLLSDLSGPAALRRAFILREVLGPPVALRGD
jgi:hypothetical protein